MKAKVENVRIRDLIAVLANLHLDYNAVDITVHPEEKRVAITPVEDSRGFSIKGEREEEGNIELGDKDLDII